MTSKSFDSLADEPLHTYVSVLASYAYLISEKLPDSERYGIASTIRQHAFRLTDDISLAIGAADPRDRVMYYQYATRDLFGIKNCLEMSTQLCGVEIDDSQLIEIERLIERTVELRNSSKSSISDYLKIFTPNNKETT